MNSTIYLLLFAHFIGDFVCQSDHIATKKSESYIILLGHCLIVTLSIFLFGLLVCPLVIIPLSLINGIIHFGIDAITSRITKYFHLKGDRHNFFVTIGFDQFLHTIILIYLCETWILPNSFT